MRASLSFSLLGPLQLQRAGMPLTLKYNKARALLAWLILEPSFHTRDHLAELLWPGRTTQDGRDRLKRMLFHLRTTLDEQLVEANRHTLRLNPNLHFQCDTREFLQHTARGLHVVDGAGKLHSRMQLSTLARAAELYRGPFLQGLEVTDAPSLEQWLQTQRQSFAGRAEAVLRDLAQGHARHTAWHEASTHARHLVALAPADESAWQLLLNILVKSGQQAEAQITLAHCIKTLASELDTQPSAETYALAAGSASAHPSPLIAEPRYLRRQVTVLCCDLRASACTDPEDQLALLEPLRQRCAQWLREAAGYVSLEARGNLLAYFGFPTALERAAQQAVHAALAVLQATGSSSGVALRIGLHSAPVVASEADCTPDCAGMATRIAEQLAAQAGAGSLVISDATRHLLDAAFVYTRCGTMNLAEVQAYEVRGWRRTQVPRQPLSGRTHALEALAHARARQHAVLVTGEAGIGKTSLVSGYRAALGLPGLDLACEPDGMDTALHPFARHMRVWQHGADWHGGRAALAALRASAALAALETPSEPPVQALRQPASAANLSLRREMTLGHLRENLARLVPPGGLLWIDDLQWADPLTFAFIVSLLDTPLPQRFLILSARPSFRLPASALARLTRQRLGPLEQPAQEHLFNYWSNGAELDPARREQILRMADGVPLFLEECARDILATPFTAAHAESGTIPPRLHDMLVARLDATGEAKAVALCAALIGNEFSVTLLAEVLDSTPAALTHLLDVLAAHRVITPRAADSYSFCHALLREAAWHMQTRVTRDTLQQRIDAARKSVQREQRLTA
ncbi:BTAD domain-containing putative transcriptional regulator [Paraburkholderia bonniea]|uniref:BTAD domain-containing putative transcriptional regulator n=1 Tax=Paraburkholderia bonniea TaxID=2152891 RepID=UPI0012929671|nr:BTAD domain-containing putative transcriptional regulator [Paraburkholderia bonniea]